MPARTASAISIAFSLIHFEARLALPIRPARAMASAFILARLTAFDDRWRLWRRFSRRAIPQAPLAKPASA